LKNENRVIQLNQLEVFSAASIVFFLYLSLKMAGHLEGPSPFFFCAAPFSVLPRRAVRNRARRTGSTPPLAFKPSPCRPKKFAAQKSPVLLTSSWSAIGIIWLLGALPFNWGIGRQGGVSVFFKKETHLSPNASPFVYFSKLCSLFHRFELIALSAFWLKQSQCQLMPLQKGMEQLLEIPLKGKGSSKI
jgi:hypothetical protein